MWYVLLSLGHSLAVLKLPQNEHKQQFYPKQLNLYDTLRDLPVRKATPVSKNTPNPGYAHNNLVPVINIPTRHTPSKGSQPPP